MGNKKIIPVWLTVFLVLLVGATVALCITKAAENASPRDYLSCIFLCASCSFSLYYCIGGYKKNSADHFQWFCICFMLLNFISIFLRAGIGNYLMLVAPAVAYGIMLVFTIAKNLGKTKSYIMWGFLMLTFIIDAAVYLYLGYGEYLFGLIGARGILDSVFGIMIYAKYADKDNRGTK